MGPYQRTIGLSWGHGWSLDDSSPGHTRGGAIGATLQCWASRWACAGCAADRRQQKPTTTNKTNQQHLPVLPQFSTFFFVLKFGEFFLVIHVMWFLDVCLDLLVHPGADSVNLVLGPESQARWPPWSHVMWSVNSFVYDLYTKRSMDFSGSCKGW